MKNQLITSGAILFMMMGMTSSANAQNWSLTGNAGTNPPTNYVGTSDSKSLVFKTNNAERMRISATGKVGIGTTTPSAKFHVTGTDATTGYFYNDYAGTGNKRGIYSEVTNKGTGTNYGIYTTCNSDSADNSPAYGVYAAALDNGDGNVTGIYGSAEGNGVKSRFGVRGVATTPSGQIGSISYGVYGNATGGSSLAENYGVYGNASGGGSPTGVYGYSDYVGVKGNASGTYTFLRGVYGLSEGSGSGTHIGIYGEANGPNSENWGGYFPTKVFVDELRVGSELQATGYKVKVDGNIICEEVRVLDSSNWPDYVFDDNYNLLSLEEVEQHIKNKKHLPGIPSACEVESNGIDLGEMQKQLMEKVEELTLYMIDLKKENRQLREEMNLMKDSK